MLVWICGSRDLELSPFAFECLVDVVSKLGASRIAHGAARGVDAAAAALATQMRLPVLVRPAQWLEFGRSAGPRRNEQLARDTKAASGVCVAVFLERGLTPGTRSAVGCALQLEVPVIRVEIRRSDGAVVVKDSISAALNYARGVPR